MTEPSLPPEKTPPRKIRWLAFLGGNTLFISILLHVLFGVGATYLIVEHFTKKHVNFHATEPPTQHTEVEHKVQLQKKNNVESAPPDLKRIVTTNVSSIVLPEPPDLPPPVDTAPSAMNGIDGVMGLGLGGGNGNGGNGGGGNPLFGASDGLGLEGTFYDLKQTPDHKPTSMATWGPEAGNSTPIANWPQIPPVKESARFLRSFLTDWNTQLLEDFYQSPSKLYNPQIFIPVLPASEAPRAFKADSSVQPRRWIVIYRAKIVPPKSGRFRFIGRGDDFLVVRIDNNNVLDGTWVGEEATSGVNARDDVGTAMAGQPLRAGAWINMQQGLAMNMQVLIGEGPGGDCGFFLFIQEEGVAYPKGDYPVFQLADVPVPASPGPGKVPPAFSGKRMVFKIESK